MENHTQELERLRAENEALKAKVAARAPKITLKVSTKGAVSVYGMGRFPVTLYAEQWIKLLGIGEDIKAFIKANSASLATKADKQAA
jgi:hypothetical protein